LAALLFDRYWRCNEDLGNETLLAALTSEVGLDWQAYKAAQRQEAQRQTGATPADLLRTNVQMALARGVFGSPFFLVDNEPFFGVEKMELLQQWLQSGGW